MVAVVDLNLASSYALEVAERKLKEEIHAQVCSFSLDSVDRGNTSCTITLPNHKAINTSDTDLTWKQLVEVFRMPVKPRSQPYFLARRSQSEFPNYAAYVYGDIWFCQAENLRMARVCIVAFAHACIAQMVK